MKRILLFTFILSLMTTTACTGKKITPENIRSKIHETYYSMNDYTASCTVTAFSESSSHAYECDISYKKDDNEYTLTSDGMTICVTDDKTIISKGDNSLESPPTDEDMYIFVNTFFKSYYESEATAMNVSSARATGQVLLECDALNAPANTARMKLWIDTESIKPVKMQVFDANDFMHTEVVFNEFNFSD